MNSVNRCCCIDRTGLEDVPTMENLHSYENIQLNVKTFKGKWLYIDRFLSNNSHPSIINYLVSLALVDMPMT